MLLPQREAERIFPEHILDLVPQGGLAQAALDGVFEVGPAARQAQHARTEGDVVVDGLRERVGFLKDHAHLLAQGDHVRISGMDILAIQGDLPLHARACDGVVHAVQASQERGFSAARRADQGRYVVGHDVQADIGKRLGRPVKEIQVPDGEYRGRHASILSSMDMGYNSWR